MKTHKELIYDINSLPLEGLLSFWWLGQLGYVLKLGGKIIYIDAYLVNSPGRAVPTLLHDFEVTNADIVIGTHDHSDHIDRANWPEVAKASPKAAFVVPNPLRKSISSELGILENRVYRLRDMETITFADIRITGIAAAHEFLDRDEQTGEYMYTGCVISYKDINIYHSGDCCIYEGLISRLQSFGHIDLMLIPINGRDGQRYRRGCIGNMTYQEAADLAGAIKPRLVCPSHYDLIYGNTEDVGKFLDYMNAKYPEIKSWTGEYGERVSVL
ncbi:MAG: MBL fold metallo-hydrolase [Clostridiales bacterium]|nr:MBL fold metallo-hydrolase [Clostridiales bacterium]